MTVTVNIDELGPVDWIVVEFRHEADRRDRADHQGLRRPGPDQGAGPAFLKKDRGRRPGGVRGLRSGRQRDRRACAGTKRDRRRCSASRTSPTWPRRSAGQRRLPCRLGEPVGRAVGARCVDAGGQRPRAAVFRSKRCWPRSRPTRGRSLTRHCSRTPQEDHRSRRRCRGSRPRHPPEGRPARGRRDDGGDRRDDWGDRRDDRRDR